MAMYYYASKISALACGTRCRQSVLQKSRGQRDRDKSQLNFIKMKESSEKAEISFSHEVSSPIKSKSSDSSCNGTISDMPREKGTSVKDVKLECSALGTGGIMYINGSISSGPLDSLVDLLMPKKTDDLDKEFVFSFLLSSRVFIRPHELLGRLLSSVPETESLERLVGLLGVWTKTFPYDFRDERIMSHVKHIVTRCSKTGLEDIVSVMLSALLNRLTDLEQHEEHFRACQNTSDKTDSIECPTPTQFAQILCRIERKLAKHVGPEEFVQCSSNILMDKQTKKSDTPSTSGGPPGIQDPKKTCNLETYLEWSARLRLFVCNEILQCNGIRDRSKIVELWSGVAQYCLLVGNYNSATAILESLESPPIARLKVTWSKLSSTCQQLDCMLRHAEGCGDLWSKQAIVLNENDKRVPTSSSSGTSSSVLQQNPKTKPNDWVVIPVFADIVKLALTAREDCLDKLPNGHINVTAFDRLAAIVGAFTKHMCEVKTTTPDVGEYETFCRHMQNVTLLNESDLLLASFDCEEPSQAEKIMYDLT